MNTTVVSPCENKTLLKSRDGLFLARRKIGPFLFGLTLLTALTSTEGKASSISITNGLKGGGVSFALSVLSDILANLIVGQLGLPSLNPGTSISETDFTSHNIYSAYGIAAYADGNLDKRGAASSLTNAVWDQKVSVVSSFYSATKAELGTKVDYGLLFNTICLGNTPCAATTEVQTSPPGKNRTVSAYGGFMFEKGNFIIVGAEKSALVGPVPIPAAIWLFGSALAGLGVLVRRGNRSREKGPGSIMNPENGLTFG